MLFSDLVFDYEYEGFLLYGVLSSDTEGQLNRKVLLQRYLEKRKDR